MEPLLTTGTLIPASSGTVSVTPTLQGTTLQAITFKSGMTDSTVHSATYYYESGNAPVLGPDTMTASTSTPRSVTYTLDKAGNRTNLSDAGVSTTYTPNNLNQYTGIGGTNNVTNGSEHELASYQGVAYTYINDERLTRVTSGANTYDLAYDALGRCVKRTLNYVTPITFMMSQNRSWNWLPTARPRAGTSTAKGSMKFGANGYPSCRLKLSEAGLPRQQGMDTV